LVTHSHEANNSCARCGNHAISWSEYEKWNGKLPEETLEKWLETNTHGLVGDPQTMWIHISSVVDDAKFNGFLFLCPLYVRVVERSQDVFSIILTNRGLKEWRGTIPVFQGSSHDSKLICRILETHTFKITPESGVIVGDALAGAPRDLPSCYNQDSMKFYDLTKRLQIRRFQRQNLNKNTQYPSFTKGDMAVLSEKKRLVREKNRAPSKNGVHHFLTCRYAKNVKMKIVLTNLGIPCKIIDRSIYMVSASLSNNWERDPGRSYELPRSEGDNWEQFTKKCEQMLSARLLLPSFKITHAFVVSGCRVKARLDADTFTSQKGRVSATDNIVCFKKSTEAEIKQKAEQVRRQRERLRQVRWEHERIRRRLLEQREDRIRRDRIRRNRIRRRRLLLDEQDRKQFMYASGASSSRPAKRQRTNSFTLFSSTLPESDGLMTTPPESVFTDGMTTLPELMTLPPESDDDDDVIEVDSMGVPIDGTATLNDEFQEFFNGMSW